MPARAVTLRELAIFAGVSLCVHVGLWMAGLPLASIDLGYYTEPAYHLVRHGAIAGPAAQHWDITYREAFFPYPPGYVLALAAWIEAFGVSARSLLTFAHAVHFAYILLLWILLRCRLNATPLASAAACLSAFPYFQNGRPELLGLLLATLAWLLVPERFRVDRLVWAGVAAGMAVETSLITGGAAIFALAGYLVAQRRARWLIPFGLSAVAAFAIVYAGAVWHSGAGALALEQARVHLSSRRASLAAGALGAPISYAARFLLVPWVLLTLVPAAWAMWSKPRAPRALAVLAAYAAEVCVYLTAARGLFLAHGSFSLLSRPALHGAIFSALPRWVAIPALALFTFLFAYFYKQDFYAPPGSRTTMERRVAALALPADAVVAVDGCLYPYFAPRGRLIHYQTFNWNNWRTYLLLTSPEVLSRVAVREPDEPAYLVVCEGTLLTAAGAPDAAKFEEVDGQGEPPARLTVAGRPLNLARDPLRVRVFRRRSGDRY